MHLSVIVVVVLLVAILIAAGWWMMERSGGGGGNACTAADVLPYANLRGNALSAAVTGGAAAAALPACVAATDFAAGVSIAQMAAWMLLPISNGQPPVPLTAITSAPTTLPSALAVSYAGALAAAPSGTWSAVALDSSGNPYLSIGVSSASAALTDVWMQATQGGTTQTAAVLVMLQNVSLAAAAAASII